MLTFASFKRTNDCFTDFKKAKKMKKLVFNVRSYRSYLFRIMW